MAKQCDRCGKILPGDSVRFCPGCGKKFASARPAKRSLSGDPPAWMKQLETSLTNNRSDAPLRELKVKVWDEEETRDLTLPESDVDSGEDEQDVLDALPTSPLMVANSPSPTPSSHPTIDVDEEEVAEELPTNPHMTSLPQNKQVSHAPSSPAVEHNNGAMPQDQIEDLETRPYAAQPGNQSLKTEQPVQQQRQATQSPIRFMHGPSTQRPMTPVPQRQSQLPPAQNIRQTPPVSMPVPTLARPQKRNRKGLVIVFGLLFFLLLGGVIAWVIVSQPFAVPEITKTTQNFNDASLAISLQYPRNWAVDVNNQNGTVFFYDANHTDQVNISVVVAANQDINQYMNKTVSSLGMTGQKSQAALSFAGAAWQQIWGSVQESGANYTATLLVTMHGEHFYAILQLAPSSTYPLEEQLVFSKMRSSFQF